MKPLVTTAGMREGSLNEIEVLRAIPKFVEENEMAEAKLYGSGDIQLNSSLIQIDYIRQVGLVSTNSSDMIADSPDGLIGYSNDDGDTDCAAIEVKTMTSIRTVDEALQLREQYGSFVGIKGIGIRATSTVLFRNLVSKPDYRLQCLHHSAVLGTKKVLFIVAKGSSMGVGEIIFAVMLHFEDVLRNAYMFVVDAIRCSSFMWIGSSSECIPHECDEILKDSHASDLFSFASFYNLSKAYKELVSIAGPLPPARMIRPTALVYWNALNGGVDEFSRALTSLSYTNTSESPIVSVLGRLICAQVNNAAIVYRLFVARNQGRLTQKEEIPKAKRMGYQRIRHDVSQVMGFSDFARGLAKEFKESISANSGANITDAQRGVGVGNHITRMKARFPSGAALKYNQRGPKERRLNKRLNHSKIRAQATYCSLCSYHHTVTYRGLRFTKKGGSREQIWCSVCEQPIYRKCWDPWHMNENLERSVIPPEELQALKLKARRPR